MIFGTILVLCRQPGFDLFFCSRAGARSFDPFTTTGSSERAILTGERLVASGDVKWSPEGGLIHEDGKGRHSPAVSLIHELGHKYFQNYDPIGTQALEKSLIDKDISLYDDYAATEKEAVGGNTGYKSYEEKWIITRVENPAAKALGQSLRTSHGKSGKFKATSVFSIISTETYHYEKVKY